MYTPKKYWRDENSCNYSFKNRGEMIKVSKLLKERYKKVRCTIQGFKLQENFIKKIQGINLALQVYNTRDKNYYQINRDGTIDIKKKPRHRFSFLRVDKNDIIELSPSKVSVINIFNTFDYNTKKAATELGLKHSVVSRENNCIQDKTVEKFEKIEIRLSHPLIYFDTPLLDVLESDFGKNPIIQIPMETVSLFLNKIKKRKYRKIWCSFEKDCPPYFKAFGKFQ